jgi:hypothetical protein
MNGVGNSLADQTRVTNKNGAGKMLSRRTVLRLGWQEKHLGYKQKLFSEKVPVKNGLQNRLANQNGAGNRVTNGVGNYVVANNNVIKNKTAKNAVMGIYV